MSYVAQYAGTAMAFIAIDVLWLGLIAKPIYKASLAGLIAPSFDMRAAGLFYLLFPLGIVVFAVEPALMAGSMSRAAMLGAMFGFFAYATYDLTNLATLKGWPVHLTAMDMAWGTTLTSIAAVAGYAAGLKV